MNFIDNNEEKNLRQSLIVSFHPLIVVNLISSQGLFSLNHQRWK